MCCPPGPTELETPRGVARPSAGTPVARGPGIPSSLTPTEHSGEPSRYWIPPFTPRQTIWASTGTPYLDLHHVPPKPQLMPAVAFAFFYGKASAGEGWRVGAGRNPRLPPPSGPCGKCSAVRVSCALFTTRTATAVPVRVLRTALGEEPRHPCCLTGTGHFSTHGE